MKTDLGPTIKLDRKVLADIAYNNPEVFKSIVKKVQSSLN